MKAFVDLHIHSGLSPCGSDEMTPNNIINMARLKGLHLISITDHNSLKNVEVISKVGEEFGIVVVPGCEVQTREEIHVLCYFPSVELGLKFQERVIGSYLQKTKNDPGIFGNQLIYSKYDEVVSKEDNMLLNSLSLGLEELINWVGYFNGISIPAHIDKQAYSILSNLGFIPHNLPIQGVEVSYKNWHKRDVVDKYSRLGYNMITASDAHYLRDIMERDFYIELEDVSVRALFNELRRCSGKRV